MFCIRFCWTVNSLLKKDPNTGDRSNIIIYRNKKNVTGSLYSGGFATRHGYKFYIIYKSLFTEKTAVSYTHLTLPTKRIV